MVTCQYTQRLTSVVGIWRGIMLRNLSWECPGLPVKTLNLHRLWLAGGMPPGWRSPRPGCRPKATNITKNNRVFPLLYYTRLLCFRGYHEKPFRTKCMFLYFLERILLGSSWVKLMIPVFMKCSTLVCHANPKQGNYWRFTIHGVPKWVKGWKVEST